MEQESTPFFSRRDLVVGFGFALANAMAHLVWNPIVHYWQFVATTLVFTAVLVVWLVKEWQRLQLWVTRFYCVVATIDLLAEGLLQPFHHCTLDNLACTGRMFLVFLAFWLVLHPLERRFFRRKPMVDPQ